MMLLDGHRIAARALSRVTLLIVAGVVSRAIAFGEHGVSSSEAIAIDRGVRYLVYSQGADGAWSSFGHKLGETSLAGIALMAGGQPVDSPSVMRAADVVRALIRGDVNTYDTSLAIMFLDRLRAPGDSDMLRELGGRLSGGQCRDGSWGYFLPRHASATPAGGDRGDNSNTQFATLAAWISRRHGVVNDVVLQRVDQYFRESFDAAAGGWSYGSRGATPTMTCAGLVGLATHRGVDQQRFGVDSSRSRPGRPAAPGPGRPSGAAVNDPVARRALEALGQELRLADRNPSHTINTDLYFYWSLERVGVIYDVREIGGVDWYAWGSKRLIDGQSQDGQWKGVGSKGWSFEKNIGTSFAILFLSRANLAEDLTAQVGSGGGVGSGPPGLGGGSQLLRRGDAAAPPRQGAAQAPPTSRRQSLAEPVKKPEVGPPVLDPF